MPGYRFYEIAQDGHVAKPPIHDECLDDGDAIKKAHVLQDRCDIEVWCGDRIVAYLLPDMK